MFASQYYSTGYLVGETTHAMCLPVSSSYMLTLHWSTWGGANLAMVYELRSS